MNLIYFIEVLMIVICSVNGDFLIGSFVRSLFDQISESDPITITTLTLLRIDDSEDTNYQLKENDIVHYIMTKVQPDYSVFYPPIMQHSDRFEINHRLGTLVVLISDLWNKKVMNSVIIIHQIKHKFMFRF